MVENDGRGGGMICYIAGPMTGLEDHNRPAFAEAEKQLREKGHKVISPAWLKDDLPKRCYLPICTAMIDQAEALVLLPGWEDSEGANVELGYAQYCGKETMTLKKALKE